MQSKQDLIREMEDSRVFSVRIVSIDYYMSPPISGVDISYSTFHGGKVKEVPVIRIFGSTPAGQKTCLHIHRALPYIYIPCSDVGHVPNNEVGSCMQAISLGLEKTLKLKGNAGSKRQHVHGCNLVRARRFYGYHSTEELFVKIYFYYPQDVSRAANLLLAGAIMDKVLQPHESHIPFLLQFLIDYNLYGMDQLHVSKIKFRHPLPDVFSPRKSRHNGELNSLADDSTGVPMNSQADIGNDVRLNLAIWTSSTISDGQILQYSCHPDSSTNEDIPLYRRQSTSELEGDAIVDEIINQQFLSYEPLCQTNSEVKMVHSLIPIWEEEIERSEVPEAMPPDSGKPLPQDVLRTLSEGIDFGEFVEVTNNKESESPFTPSIKCSTDHRNSVESGLLNFEVSNNLSSKYLKASDKIGALFSLDSLSQAVNEGETSEADAIDQLQISGTVEQSTEKASDEDAFRLLKWLASSQAAEDINSDDELAHETILSPLIPAKNIDKVLEKANVDYESESQKECQDILDSIDMLNFEEFSGGVSKPIDYNHYSEAFTNKVIPQVDGSSDDPPSTPCSSKSLKSDTNEADKSLEVHLLPELDSRLIHKNQRKRQRWGSLPIFHENMNEVSLPNAFNILSECDVEKKEGFGITGCGNEAERFPCFVKNDERKDAIYTEQASWTTECSTRELMRRKRSHRVELSKLRNPVVDSKVETCSNAEYGKGDIDLDTKLRIDIQDGDSSCLPMRKPLPTDEGTKCHEKDIHSIRKMCSEVSDVKPVKSCYPTLGNSTLCSSASMALGNMANDGNQESVQLDHGLSYSWENLNNSVNYNASLHASTCTFEHPRSSKSDIIGENFGCRDLLQTDAGPWTVSNLAASKSISGNECQSESGSQISMQKAPENPAEGLKDMSSETTLLQFENSQYYESSPGFCVPHCSMADYVKKEAEKIKFIGMTFYNKPPIIQWTDEPENEAPVLPTYGSLNDGTTVQGRSMEGCLPFFTRNCPQEKELQAPEKYDYFDHQELVMGVPVLYQNDGSFLYMLTPVISPPSRECVDRWLSFDGSHILRENMDAPSLFPSLPIGSSSVMTNSLGSQADVNYSPALVSAPFSDANPNLDQLRQLNQESCSMEAESLKETEKNPLAGKDFSQISGPDKKLKPTPLSQIGFQDPARVGGGQQLTLLSIEVLAESRGDLRPNPQFDPINVIVLVLQEDDESTLDVHVLLRCNYACVEKDLYAMSQCKVLVFTEESQLFSHFTKLIHSIDPDVIMGWDVQSSSLGLLAERAAHLGLGLLNNISRTPSETNVVSGDSEATGKDMVIEIFSESDAAEAVHLENTVIGDEWGRTHTSGVRVGGRIVLNIWRLMRNEVKLNMYTVEAVAKEVLRLTIPFIHWKVLTKWFSSGPGRARCRSIYYILERAKLNLQIMNQLDVINRTSELARVFGIDFFSVLSRGSQYRVESMFLRLAHTQNYLAISPGNQQVANQPAMECLPLVMEPESGFYSDPVIVLDFQSLYPSMVIAYNLCFCTCLGKITPPKENCLGVSSYSPDINILHNLKHELLVTPNGVVYVSPKVQKGILPRLLEEILSTRIMVKQAMKKLAPSQLILNRIYNARQLALKLISNVTYGYTAAGFSGRMPCAELADSIVQCGRKTLETAISFVNSNEKWKAKVVYGDTDSMFVLLKGRSLKEAFAIGREIASAITEMNPNPVMLKMEKVYYPCFLLTKKRYVGYSYESPDQSKPMFDAKGIETVRRDTCEAVSKTMEQSLRIYFESQNIDEVKSYMLRQWARILSGRVSIQDFVFAKEVRLGTYSARASSLPPAAIVATKAMRADPRAEPRYAERIPYVVVHGEPGARLVDMVVDPLELLALSNPFRLNDIYYIRKQIIPTLQRVFGLVRADLNQWFVDMPRRGREGVGKCNSLVTNPLRTRIDCYYISNHCILCGNVVQASARLCHNCLKNETTVAAALTGRSSKLEKDIQHLIAICRHCGGGDWLIESGVKCTSLACPVFYERRKVQKELRSVSEVATATGFYPKCVVEWF